MGAFQWVGVVASNSKSDYEICGEEGRSGSFCDGGFGRFFLD